MKRVILTLFILLVCVPSAHANFWIESSQSSSIVPGWTNLSADSNTPYYWDFGVYIGFDRFSWEPINPGDVPTDYELFYTFISPDGFIPEWIPDGAGGLYTEPQYLTPGRYSLDYAVVSDGPDWNTPASIPTSGYIDILSGSVRGDFPVGGHQRYIWEDLAFNFIQYEDGDPNKWIKGGYNTPYSHAVPEPATMALFGIGLIGVARLRRKKL